MNLITQYQTSIYVACLASYNNGKLHGIWIDCSEGEDFVWDEIKKMLKNSSEPNAQDWAIHDFDFSGIQVSEYGNIEKLCEYAEIFQKLGEQTPVFIELLKDFDSEKALEMINNNLIGSYKSDEEFIYEYLEDTCFFEGIPQYIIDYFDQKAYFRDLELNGDIFKIQISYNENYYFNNF